MPNQVCCSLSGLLCPAPPKVDKPLQMFEADQRRHATNRRQVMHSFLKARANGVVFKRWQRESILACH